GHRPGDDLGAQDVGDPFGGAGALQRAAQSGEPLQSLARGHRSPLSALSQPVLSLWRISAVVRLTGGCGLGRPSEVPWLPFARLENCSTILMSFGWTPPAIPRNPLPGGPDASEDRMSGTKGTGAPVRRAAGRSALLGAVFLMATSAIGPGFITQTTEFTATLGAAFAFAIVVSILIDIAVQLN